MSQSLGEEDGEADGAEGEERDDGLGSAAGSGLASLRRLRDSAFRGRVRRDGAGVSSRGGAACGERKGRGRGRLDARGGGKGDGGSAGAAGLRADAARSESLDGNRALLSEHCADGDHQRDLTRKRRKRTHCYRSGRCLRPCRLHTSGEDRRCHRCRRIRRLS